MPSEDKKVEQTLGFLSVSGDIKQGLLGGLLVLNRVGRPVEFHCTAPVRANRAQEILYGNTLFPFLAGEQIAPTLVSKTGAPMLAVLTDSPWVLTGAPLVKAPLLFVFYRKKNGDGTAEFGCDSFDAFPFIPGFDAGKWSTFNRGKYSLAAMPGTFGSQGFDDEFDLFLEAIDPREPFERIRLAVDEAQKAG